MYKFHYFTFEKRATFITIITCNLIMPFQPRLGYTISWFRPNLNFVDNSISSFYQRKKIHCVQQFHNPNDDTSAPPTPVRIFPARYEVASPAEVQQPVVLDDVVEGDENIPVSTCDFCLRSPCITQSEFKPMGRGEARLTNHTKRRKDYKWFWGTLKDCGL